MPHCTSQPSAQRQMPWSTTTCTLTGGRWHNSHYTALHFTLERRPILIWMSSTVTLTETSKSCNSKSNIQCPCEAKSDQTFPLWHSLNLTGFTSPAKGICNGVNTVFTFCTNILWAVFSSFCLIFLYLLHQSFQTDWTMSDLCLNGDWWHLWLGWWRVTEVAEVESTFTWNKYTYFWGLFSFVLQIQ